MHQPTRDLRPEATEFIFFVYHNNFDAGGNIGSGHLSHSIAQEVSRSHGSSFSKCLLHIVYLM